MQKKNSFKATKPLIRILCSSVNIHVAKVETDKSLVSELVTEQHINWYRAATSYYFNYQFICWLFSQFINQLFGLYKCLIWWKNVNHCFQNILKYHLVLTETKRIFSLRWWRLKKPENSSYYIYLRFFLNKWLIDCQIVE